MISSGFLHWMHSASLKFCYVFMNPYCRCKYLFVQLKNFERWAQCTQLWE